MHRPRWACLVAATEVVEANRTHSGVLEQERETVTLTVTPEREGLRVYTRGGEDPIARTRVAAVRAADPQMQFPRLHCIFISRIEFRLRRNAPPFGQSARHETADTGPHRRTARHPHAPHAPEARTRAPALRGIRRLCQTAAVSLWRALSPECLPPSAHPGARPRVSEARSEAHVTFASSSPHLPRVIWIEIRGTRGAASPRRQRLCRRR